MPNWCYHYITVECFTNAQEKAVGELLEVITNAKTHIQGWMHPSLLESLAKNELQDLHYLYDLESDDEFGYFEASCYTFRLTTKWSPAIEDFNFLATVGDINGSKWTIEFEEGGMEIFGKHIVQADTKQTIRLEEEDLERMTYDEGNDVYMLDGEVVECQMEAVENLIHEKEFNLNASTT